MDVVAVPSFCRLVGLVRLFLAVLSSARPVSSCWVADDGDRPSVKLLGGSYKKQVSRCVAVDVVLP
jgi:hypothetical protein